jgi:hypothetical protein
MWFNEADSTYIFDDESNDSAQSVPSMEAVYHLLSAAV